MHERHERRPTARRRRAQALRARGLAGVLVVAFVAIACSDPLEAEQATETATPIPSPTAPAGPTLEPVPAATPPGPAGGPIGDDERFTAGILERWLPLIDVERRTILLTELLNGGVGADSGIPSIQAPRFITAGEAGEWLADREPVITLEVEGEARIYPIQILMWHEVANDRLGDVPVVVTFCPLCNSAVAFDRRVDGEMYRFGVSGMLRENDLVMFDYETHSLWQQITGEGLVGAHAGDGSTSSRPPSSRSPTHARPTRRRWCSRARRASSASTARIPTAATTTSIRAPSTRHRSRMTGAFRRRNVCSPSSTARRRSRSPSPRSASTS